MLQHRFPSRKKSRTLPIILILTGFLAIGTAAWYYGPAIYYRYFDTSGIFLIQSRDEQLRTRLLSEKTELSDFYTYLKDSEIMTSNLEKKFADNPSVYYYHGLFRFYDFLIRVPLDNTSLLTLTGRKYLPSQRVISEIPEADAVMLAREMSVNMRKAVALGLNSDLRPVADSVTAIGDLYFTSRTDFALLDLIKSVNPEKIPQELIPSYRWMKMAMLSIHGKNKDLTDFIAVSDAKPAFYSPYFQDKSVLNNYDKDLLTAYSHFYSKNYIPALLIARNIRNQPTVEERYKTEALIIEAEIFLVQRGPALALQLYQLAKSELKEKDIFIEERIQSLQLPVPRGPTR